MTEGYSTWEELKAELEARDAKRTARRSSSVFWRVYYMLYDVVWAIRRALTVDNLSCQVRKPKWAWQRMRRGWSDRDVWSFDRYLAGVIAGGLDKLSDGISHPSDLTAEQWEDLLDEIAGALLRYRNDDLMNNEITHQEAVAALHRLADRFGDLWD